MYDQGSYTRRLRHTEGHTRTGHAHEMKGHTYGYTRRDIHRERRTHGGDIHREKHMLRATRGQSPSMDLWAYSSILVTRWMWGEIHE